MIKSLIERVKSLSFIDCVQTIGGFLIMMYIPLFIGLIWFFDTQMMIKLIATNSTLILGIYMIHCAQND